MDKEIVGGVVTDAYHYPASWHTSPRVSTQVILIPGNPGLLFFYLPFLERLGKSLLAGRTWCCVHGFGLAGHHLYELEDQNVEPHTGVSLECQIQHVYLCIMSILENHHPGKIILVGHSIGSYLVMEVLSRFMDIREKVVAVAHLMPFIRWKNIPFYHKIKLTAYLYTESASNAVIHLVHSRIQQLSLAERIRLCERAGIRMGETWDVVPLIAGRLAPSTRLLINFFAMGRDEIQVISREEERLMDFLRGLDGLCGQLILITDDDEWCPEADALFYRKFLSHTRVEFRRGLTHGFTFTNEGMEQVADLLKTFINSSSAGSSHILSKL